MSPLADIIDRAARAVSDALDSVVQLLRHWLVRRYIDEMKKKLAALAGMDTTALVMAIKMVREIASKAELSADDIANAKKIRDEVLGQ